MKESVEIALTLVESPLSQRDGASLQKRSPHPRSRGRRSQRRSFRRQSLWSPPCPLWSPGRPVNPKIAMTGEVSLRGGVMPIGGLPEKLMAAQRAGITKVLIPQENVEDLEDVAEEVKRKSWKLFPSETCRKPWSWLF